MPAGAALAGAQKAGNVVVFGSVLTIAISFIIPAFVIAMMVKQMNRMKHAKPAAARAAPAPAPQGVLLRRDIRNALRK